MSEGIYRAGVGDRLSYLGAAAGMHTGADTPRAFLERCISRIEAHEGQVRAFAALDLAAARAAADAATRRWARGVQLSPLDGCPVGVKDIIQTLGLPTQMNSPLFKSWQSPWEAQCVAALRAAGAVVVGKTHTTEFAVGTSPPTTNPWDPSRTPGGSSSGSAASVGCGMLPLALGTQTVGSILRPSGFCGAVGYKPTHGALPTAGLHPLSRTLDHLGPIAGSVEDACAAVRIMQEGFGADAAAATAWVEEETPPRAPVRLARIRIEGDAAVDGSALAVFEAYLERLRESGVRVVGAADDAGLAELEASLAVANTLCMTILRYEMRWPLEEYARRVTEAVGPRIREHLAEAERVTLAQYREALSRREALRQQVARIAVDLDGFVLPAASGVAPEGLAYTGDRTMLAPWSVVGGPAWSLPLLAVENLPFGVQLAGAPGSDQATARIARWMMEA